MIMNNVIKPSRTQVFRKKSLQDVLKQARQGGYDVVKGEGSYEIYSDDNREELVLRALVGSAGYLVTYTEELLGA
jgi:1-deoxy-D-xylulose 5-phosphate reductoisomerase